MIARRYITLICHTKGHVNSVGILPASSAAEKEEGLRLSQGSDATRQAAWVPLPF